MSETLRDLVVSLSLNSDNFTRNIRSVQRQIQEAQSEFQLAAAGIRNFEQTTEGLTAKLTSLDCKARQEQKKKEPRHTTIDVVWPGLKP